jgi:hypothetical protein
MPVSPADIVFYPGQRNTDAPDSGGPPRYWPLPDGLVNNAFGDITGAMRTTGYVAVRKVFPGLANTDADGLSGAAAYVDVLPTEAGVDSLMFNHGDRSTTRDQSVPPFGAVLAVAGTEQYSRVDPVDFAIIFTGLPKGQIRIVHGSAYTFEEGDALLFFQPASDPFGRRVAVAIAATAYVSAIVATGTYYGANTTTVEYELIYESPSGFLAVETRCARVEPAVTATGAKCVSVATLTAGAGVGATVLEVDRVLAQFVPWSGVEDTGLDFTLYYPVLTPLAVPVPTAAQVGVDPTVLRPWWGQVPIFRRTGQVLVTDGATSAVATVQRVGFDGKLHLTTGLSAGFGTGARVCGLIPIGDMESSAEVLHSQRTWTRVFSDALIGPSVPDLYDDATYPLAIDNKGVIEQRWAVVFDLDGTSFTLHGDTVGAITTGDTGTTLAPINPVTGTPYFTLLAAGWIPGAEVANALRFNTHAPIAADSLWVSRTNPPNPTAFLSAPDSVTIAMRGSGGTTGTVELPWLDGTDDGGAGTPPPAPPSVGDEPPVTPPLSAGGSIPAQASYRLVHTLTVVDEATSAPLPVERLTIAFDDGSVCWTLNAAGRPALFALFAESATPRQVRVTIDGLQWLFVVEGVTRARNEVAELSVQFTGRSIAMVSGEPYALPRNWINDGAVTAAQLCIFSQETTGTLVQWYAQDWLIPDKVWTFAGSPLAVVQRVAEAIGAGVFCDRVANVVYVVNRYPFMPSEWAAATPDVTIAEAAIRSDAFQRADRPAYTSVYVSGQQQGVIGQVYLAGTDGSAQAPLVTDLLITDTPAVRQRGRAILGAGGRQALVQMRLPVMVGAGRPGVLSPGQLVEVAEATPWRGMVRAVSVSVALPVVEQTLVIERHF